MLVAFVIPEYQTSADVTVAVLSALDSLDVGVVCRRIEGTDNPEWEPLYSLVAVGGASERLPLPHCFVLSYEALEALKNLIWIEGP